MKLVTLADKKLCDELSINREGISARTLMKNAGHAFVRVLKKNTKLKTKKILILCGPGNNGGDGLVIASLLKRSDAFVTVSKSVDQEKIIDGAPDIIIDALFGTGLSRPIAGPLAKIIRWANAQKCERWSVDCPSGLMAGRKGVTFMADHTVTFGFALSLFFQFPEYKAVGQVHVVDIGLSKKVMGEIKTKNFLITKELIQPSLQPRAREAHKGQFGHVGVVGGSESMIGAPLMAGYAALRAGAGRVTVCVPEAGYSKIDLDKLELMIHPIKKSWPDYFMDYCKKFSVLALGPGLGRFSDMKNFVKALLSFEGPMLLDADALWWLAKNLAWLKKRAALTLLTPHEGEMAQLIGRSSSWVRSHRHECARDFASKHQVHLLLKGYYSVLAFPDGRIFINPTGNPAMASAGQGDVLTGLISAFLTQGKTETRFLAPIYLHGLVGDLLVAKGYPTVLAMDIVRNWHLAYLRLGRLPREGGDPCVSRSSGSLLSRGRQLESLF